MTLKLMGSDVARFGPDGDQRFIAHLAPATRLQPDRSWIARYAGLDDLEGRGASEEEAKQMLVAELHRFVFFTPGGMDRMDELIAAGGSDDIHVLTMSRSDVHSVYEGVVDAWSKADLESGSDSPESTP